MCPACIATVAYTAGAWLAGGAVATFAGNAAVIATRKLLARSAANPTTTKEDRNG